MGIGKLFGDLIGGAGSNLIKGATELLDEVTYSKEEKEQARREWQKQATETFIKLQEVANQAEAKYLDDLASARDMQKAALAQDDLFSKRFIYYFITAWSVFAMAFLLGVTFWPVPEGSQRFADTILGFLLGTAIASVFQFMVGSTRSSRAKDETIGTMARKLMEDGTGS